MLREWMWWRPWSVEPKTLPTATEPLCLTSTLKIATPKDPPKWIWAQPAKRKWGSTRTYTAVAKCVWVYWALGEAMQVRTGILRFPPFCRCWCHCRPLSWVKKSTSMNLGSNRKQALPLERRRTRAIPTLSSIATSSMLCWIRSETLLLVSRMLSGDTSTSRGLKSWRRSGSGRKSARTSQPCMSAWSRTTTTTGPLSSKKHLPLMKLCWMPLSRN